MHYASGTFRSTATTMANFSVVNPGWVRSTKVHLRIVAAGFYRPDAFVSPTTKLMTNDIKALKGNIQQLC